MITYLGVDLVALIETAGYIGLFTIIFAETGLFLGFFLPGDSLIFVAGFLASQGFFDPALLSVILFIAAVTGNSIGYAFGKKMGRGLFTKQNSLLFKKENIDKTKEFYNIYGGKTVMLARFVPIVRTFAPILAGVAEMKYTTFLLYNIIGASVWTAGLVWLGYFLGSTIPDIDKYLLPVVLAIIAISILPGIFHVIKGKTKKVPTTNSIPEE
ncbi:MAG: DedA family protein [Candidatus Yonathbacteria bacterium]|nr:DedA family protein [Candidatus Yonathbacteria bacterium]